MANTTNREVNETTMTNRRRTTCFHSLLYIWCVLAACVVVSWVLYGAKRDALHAEYQNTTLHMMFWHDQMSSFRDQYQRSPKSADELKAFVQRTCETKGIDYSDVVCDAWGNELAIHLIDHDAEWLLSISSLGPNQIANGNGETTARPLVRELFYPK